MSTKKQRSDAARVLGQTGWSKGGLARAAKLTPKRRREIAKIASEAAKKARLERQERGAA